MIKSFRHRLRIWRRKVFPDKALTRASELDLPSGYVVSGPAKWFPGVIQIVGLSLDSVAVPQWAYLASIMWLFVDLRRSVEQSAEDTRDAIITAFVSRARDDLNFRTRMNDAFAIHDENTRCRELQKLAIEVFPDRAMACPTCGRHGGLIPYPKSEGVCN